MHRNSDAVRTQTLCKGKEAVPSKWVGISEVYPLWIRRPPLLLKNVSTFQIGLGLCKPANL
jgi:hypothetical protein